MVTTTIPSALSDPKSITDEESASDALYHTLAVVATMNRQLATAPGKNRPGEPLEDLSTPYEHLK